MKLFIRRVLLIGTVALGFFLYRHQRAEMVKVKAPTTRYPAHPTFQQAIKDTKLFTVLISVEEWGQYSRGTGVLLDKTHVLTCEHVVSHEGLKTMVYFYPGYILAHGKTVFSDASIDLAILELDVPANAPKYAAFTTTYHDGEPIVAIGNALGGLEWFVNYGIISGSNEKNLFSANLIFHGDSGGPWVNDKAEIVAISAWGLNDDSGINGGISARVVNEFLARYAASEKEKKKEAKK